METLTQVPDLASVAGISTGVLLFVSLIKHAYPKLKGGRTLLLAIGIGIGLSVGWTVLCQMQFSVPAVSRAVLTGAFGGAGAAAVALAVRAPKRK